MEKINIKVAFCEECEGYHCATPADNSLINHPEIIDHYFYHGEPWFTLDLETFNNTKIIDDAQVKIISLKMHRENDYKYCKCIRRTDLNALQNNHQIYQDANQNALGIAL